MPISDPFYDSFVSRVAPAHYQKLVDGWQEVGDDAREYGLSLPMRTHPRKIAMLDGRRWRMRAQRLRSELAERKADD